MMPFVELSELPQQLHHCAVRDLAWVLLSPSLLSQCPWPQRHPMAASVWQRQPAQLADWLRLQDASPEALEAWLTQRSVRRLGLYYERLWQFALHSAPDIEVLAANLPIREHGHTLGELDLLLRDEQGIHHVELAIKLYLGQPLRSGLDHADWLGPGSHDRLDIKLDHLGHHQLPLSNSPQALATLESLAVAHNLPSLWMGGYLFYPTQGACLPPSGHHPEHLRGRWIHQQQFAHFAQHNPGHWQPLARHSWLAPAVIEPSQRWDQNQLQQWLESVDLSVHAQLLVRLVPCLHSNNWREAERLFIVHNAWPETH